MKTEIILKSQVIFVKETNKINKQKKEEIKNRKFITFSFSLKSRLVVVVVVAVVGYLALFCILWEALDWA